MHCARLVIIVGCLMLLCVAPGIAQASEADAAKEKAWTGLSTTACKNKDSAENSIDTIGENLVGMEDFQGNLPENKVFDDVERAMEEAITRMKSVSRGMKRYRSTMKELCTLQRPEDLSQEDEIALFNTHKATFDKAQLNYKQFSQQYESAFARYVQAVRDYKRLMNEPIPLQ